MTQSKRIPIRVELVECPKDKSYSMIIGLTQMNRFEANHIMQSLEASLASTRIASLRASHKEINVIPWMDKWVDQLVSEMTLRLQIQMAIVRIEVIKSDFDKVEQASFSTTTDALKYEWITARVCGHYQIGVDELHGKSRTKRVVIPRQVVSYLARRYTEYSYPELGRLLHRDHTTIIFAVKQVALKMKSDKRFTEMIQDFQSDIDTRIKFEELNAE